VITDIREHNPFAFWGAVSEAGYEWAKGKDGKQHLIPRREPGIGYRACKPHSALFLEFAKMPPSKEAIQNFASLYGDLYSRYGAGHSGTRKDGTVASGASLGTWAKESGDMRVLVGLWRDIQQRQIAALKKIIKWGEREVGYEIKTPLRERSATLAHADIPATGFARFGPKDVVLPARCALQLEINLRLAEHSTVAQLSWTTDTRDTSGDYYQRIVFQPPNLLAAMWLQFAQAVTGEFQLKVCEGCGKHFQAGPGGRRADATTCSDVCRQRKRRNNSA
jgi:hypothetical protein